MHSTVPEKAPSSESENVDKFSKKFGDAQLKASLEGAIILETPNVPWSEVAGLELAKEQLLEAVVFPNQFPEMFTGKRKPRTSILLYGPPGTGKSYLAKAIATEAENYTVISISSGDVMSKWIGESESLIRQLFKLARERKPSIIFIDEVDTICGDRSSGNQNLSAMKTELLVQIDGMGSDNSGVVLIAATNLPWDLDPALRRRLQQRIHIPLPDKPARRELFQIHVGSESGVNLNDKDYDQLAQMTEGYSGSDIANVVQTALAVPGRKVYAAKYFRKLTHGDTVLYSPCAKEERGALAMTWRDLSKTKKRLKVPEVNATDFYEILRDGNAKSSIEPNALKRYAEWTKQYGSVGA